MKHGRESLCEELVLQLDDAQQQGALDNFAFEVMRAFRHIDSKGLGEIEHRKVRLVLRLMRFKIRSWTNPFSLCHLSPDTLIDNVDDEGSGVVDAVPQVLL